MENCFNMESQVPDFDQKKIGHIAIYETSDVENVNQPNYARCNTAPTPSYFSVNSTVADQTFRTSQKIQGELLLLERKAQYREAERERRKTQRDALEIRNGCLTVHTENTRLSYPIANASNILNPVLTAYSNIETDELIYSISFELGNRKCEIFLKAEDMGEGAIILKKLQAVGGCMLADKKSRQVKWAGELVTILFASDYKIVPVPFEDGWYIDRNGKLKFQKGGFTWKILRALV